MKHIDFVRASQLLANFGVIAGLLFLGMELRQNNEVLSAQARLQRTQMRIDGLTEYAGSPDLIRARLKDARGDVLAEEESVLLGTIWTTVLVRWQYIYGEFQEGLVDYDDIPVEGWKRTMKTYPSMGNVWRESKTTDFRSDFATWMDANVVVSQ